jgi:hypothetical protein
VDPALPVLTPAVEFAAIPFSRFGNVVKPSHVTFRFPLMVNPGPDVCLGSKLSGELYRRHFEFQLRRRCSDPRSSSASGRPGQVRSGPGPHIYGLTARELRRIAFPHRYVLIRWRTVAGHADGSMVRADRPGSCGRRWSPRPAEYAVNFQGEIRVHLPVRCQEMLR